MRNTRRCFLGLAAVAAVCPSGLRGDTTDPWPKEDLLEPAELAQRLKHMPSRPLIISVVFPVLYRQRHIIHAEFAGPGSKPEGIDALKSLVAKVSKDSEIVIYCGCCPMVKCPNIRPAYQTLKDLGYRKVRVLNLPTNFHTDWVEKGYPVEAQLGVPVVKPKL